MFLLIVMDTELRCEQVNLIQLEYSSDHELQKQGKVKELRLETWLIKQQNSDLKPVFKLVKMSQWILRMFRTNMF